MQRDGRNVKVFHYGDLVFSYCEDDPKSFFMFDFCWHVASDGIAKLVTACMKAVGHEASIFTKGGKTYARTGSLEVQVPWHMTSADLDVALNW